MGRLRPRQLDIARLRQDGDHGLRASGGPAAVVRQDPDGVRIAVSFSCSLLYPTHPLLPVVSNPQKFGLQMPICVWVAAA